MKVELLSYTPNAKELLIFTKRTRLKMSPDGMSNVYDMTHKEKLLELEYMANTIPSSWEFVDYTFLIEDVSRAFTHQLVRNRQGSYAQQSQRVTEMLDFDYIGEGEDYDMYMDQINKMYKSLIRDGVPVEDARGVLPTNICTNIVAKYNLRTLSEVMAARASVRTQSEYRGVLDEMYLRILEVHPWAHLFLRDAKYEAAQRIESVIRSEYEGTDLLAPAMKQLDILRKK